MKPILLCLILLGTGISVAKEYNITMSWPFFAPDVADEQDLNSVLGAGDIVYDTTENKFYGKTGTGNSWADLGATGTTNKFERKALTSDVTGTGVLSDLTFNNLVTGKFYRISGQFLQRDDASGWTDSNLNINVRHNSATIGNVNERTRSNSAGLESDDKTWHVNIIFEAAASSVTFDVTSSTNTQVIGDGTQAETYVTLEELNNYTETTDF